MTLSSLASISAHLCTAGHQQAVKAGSQTLQVSTRFLSACPPLYWYAARLAGSRAVGLRRVVWAFFLGYLVLGVLLFPNSYPWT